ncbi:TetR/AcrR family transcriptional regulator C-terminal domain-containing protein [Nonomuraea sp. CA-218870]|uniref:TetR/AcrR family transcriptional regulator C-terminal domain-containing protein n=1 Tax=Nonomuraea sp. CA-218870 TaxID=3239998 RepID=UPI003D94FBFE
MVVYAGQGDPRRSMALLWRAGTAAEPRPGPKPGLSVDEIVDAAIAIADADGMAALSMRRVGERLGRSGMALYTYVPGKSELIDLMYDRALASLPASYDLSGGWRAAASAWSREVRAFYLRHPWALRLSQARPVLGPNEFTLLESLAAILQETGLPPEVLRGAVALLTDFVRGSAATVAETRQAGAETGVPDEEWWRTRSAVLAEVAPGFAGRYPALSRVDSEPPRPGEEPVAYLERKSGQAFEHGLVLVLDGLEAARSRLS